MSTTLIPCPTEDSTDCFWNAQSSGNGEGVSFVSYQDIYYQTPSGEILAALASPETGEITLTMGDGSFVVLRITQVPTCDEGFTLGEGAVCVPIEQEPVEAPVEQAPVESAPIEQAPVTETPEYVESTVQATETYPNTLAATGPDDFDPLVLIIASVLIIGGLSLSVWERIRRRNNS